MGLVESRACPRGPRHEVCGAPCSLDSAQCKFECSSQHLQCDNNLGLGVASRRIQLTIRITIVKLLDGEDGSGTAPVLEVISGEGADFAKSMGGPGMAPSDFILEDFSVLKSTEGRWNSTVRAWVWDPPFEMKLAVQPNTHLRLRLYMQQLPLDLWRVPLATVHRMLNVHRAPQVVGETRLILDKDVLPVVREERRGNSEQSSDGRPGTSVAPSLTFNLCREARVIGAVSLGFEVVASQAPQPWVKIDCGNAPKPGASQTLSTSGTTNSKFRGVSGTPGQRSAPVMVMDANGVQDPRIQAKTIWPPQKQAQRLDARPPSPTKVY